MTAIDGPLPGTADTSRFEYDAARQQTKMVGPDPDGTGSRRGLAVRTTYDKDGRPRLIKRGNADADGKNFGVCILCKQGR